ncbi:MAG: helix-turn-helix domain-containing protein [Pseudomonadota bacterium]|nr:helix-turn-helix domain-containing protein [Pseudomonadota bacterium]
MNSITILTVNEAAELLKVQPATIRRLAREEKIPAKKVGKSWRFIKQSLLTWLQSPEKTPCSKSINEATFTTSSSASEVSEYESLLGLPRKH